MTLGGLAAAVGLVIDDAIVVVENIVMHRDSGQSRAEAIRSAIREIRVPLVGSTITPDRGLPAADFDHRRERRLLPRAGGDGGSGAADFAGAGAHLDADAEPLLPPRPFAAGRRRSITPCRRGLLRVYERALRIVAGAQVGARRCFPLVLIAGSYVCYNNTGTDLLPAMDEGGFIVDYIMPAGSSLAETNRVITHVEKILHATPEVESTSRRTGLQLGLAQVTEANTGDISVKLKRNRKRSGDEVIAEVRDKIKKAEPVLRRRIPAAAAGHDRRSDQRARAGRDQAVRAGSGAARRSGPRPSATPSRRFRAWWTCSTASRTRSAVRPRMFKVDPVAAARAGFSPQEVELDASAILQGEPASDAGGGERSLLHDPRALSRTTRARRSTPSATRCW